MHCYLMQKFAFLNQIKNKENGELYFAAVSDLNFHERTEYKIITK